MPEASDVTPERWSDLTVLYDDGGYSVVSGIFEEEDGTQKRALGMRWNGSESDLGFPNQAGNPIWHVVPDFLACSILHTILEEAISDSTKSSGYIEKITQEIEAIAPKIKKRI